jgi:aminopeptidase YwaD
MESTFQNYEKFIELLQGDRNPLTAKENHQSFPIRLQKYLKEKGIPNVEIQTFEWKGVKGKNVYILPPESNKSFTLILAHHDTVPESPGVDDNGSGMLITSELIEWYHKKKANGELLHVNLAFLYPDFEEGDPRVWPSYLSFCEKSDTSVDWQDFQQDTDFTLKFYEYMKVSMPDRGSFVGTRKFVELLKSKEMLDHLKLVIDFETIGFEADEQQPIPNVPIKLDRGDFIAIAINAEAQAECIKINEIDSPVKRIALPIPNKGLPIPDSRRSDHSVFWDMGINAMLVTDTANFRNPNYHMPTDTEVDYSYMHSVVEFFKSYLSF